MIVTCMQNIALSDCEIVTQVSTKPAAPWRAHEFISKAQSRLSSNAMHINFVFCPIERVPRMCWLWLRSKQVSRSTFYAASITWRWLNVDPWFRTIHFNEFSLSLSLCAKSILTRLLIWYLFSALFCCVHVKQWSSAWVMIGAEPPPRRSSSSSFVVVSRRCLHTKSHSRHSFSSFVFRLLCARTAAWLRIYNFSTSSYKSRREVEKVFSQYISIANIDSWRERVINQRNICQLSTNDNSCIDLVRERLLNSSSREFI